MWRLFDVGALAAKEQRADANAECRQIPPLLRHGISSGVARRDGSQDIADSAEFGVPALTKLITTFPLGRYEISAVRRRTLP